MDSAHFLLPRNRDHPVRAGAGADGGFVRVWIRIGEVLFYSFFFCDSPGKGQKAPEMVGVQTGRRRKPRRARALSLSVIGRY